MAEEATNKPTQRTERIGKYEILEHIATGGMGVVYKARDTDLDRMVALKILPPDVAKNQITLTRFKREAQAAARLRHENIVAIFDVGETGGTHYIALEFIEGTDLQDYINRKCRLDPDDARQIMIQAARALAHAHEQGIVHRDIKPSNFLLMTKDNRLIVKLTDFGLAIRKENDEEFRITRDKTTVGTVDYMSPEQARDSRSADIRSDIYSLGCTAFHMLAGLAPFAKGTLPERIIQHMQAAPPDMRRIAKGLPEDLVAVINRMLAKKPEDRYQTPAELLRDLEHPENVAPLSKPIKKVERDSAKKTGEMPAVIDDKEIEKELEKAIEEPKRIKLLDKKKKKKPSGATKVPQDDSEALALTKVRPDTAHDDEPKPEKGRKKSAQSPWLTYAVAGTVGVLFLTIVLALAFGNRTPPPKKAPPPPPVVVIPQEKPEPPPPEGIDTSPSKMTVGPYDLPIMIPALAKADVAALRKEYFGPFTAFPVPPEKTRVVQLRRMGPIGLKLVRTMAEALAEAPPEQWTVIEIHDDGPIFVSSLPALAQRSIVLRGAAGYRPVVAWDMPKRSNDGKLPAKMLTLTQGTLILENLDIVMKAADDAPAILFDLPDTHFYARDCTFSLVGKASQPITLLRRHGSADKTPDARKTQTWLKRCYVRGPEITLLDLQKASTDLLLEESLVAGQHQPLIQMRSRDDDSLAVHCVRSTLVAGQILLRWQPLTGKQGTPRIAGRILDSILSRDDDKAALGAMIHLDEDADLTNMSWRAANSIYAGWKHLLASSLKNIGGNDLEGWQRQWLASEGERTSVDAWPSNPPSSLEEQPASTFVPFPSPVGFAALTGRGAAGSLIGWLPAAPEGWLERVYEPPAAPTILAGSFEAPPIVTGNDGLYYGERLDLNQVDLGAYLNAALQKKKPAPHVVMHLYGKGPCATSTLRIKGVQHLVLYFVQPKDARDAIMLEVNAAGLSQRLPLIEMTGGHLELIGARVQLSPATFVPTIIHVHGGNLSLTRCRLEGPLSKSAEAFKALVTVSNANASPTTLLVRDSLLVSGKALILLQDQVQLKARTNVFLSLGDGVQIEGNSRTEPLTHVLDHNTWAVRQAVFALRAGPEFQASGSVSMYASSNAFLHPFADDGDKGTLLRGVDPWATRGCWNWQGRFNVYDKRWHDYFAGTDKLGSDKQTLKDWQLVWGQTGEQDSLLLNPVPPAKTMATDALTHPALAKQMDRLALPPQLVGDPSAGPPGADLVAMGLLKKKG